jgi:hypothetical protein
MNLLVALSPQGLIGAAFPTIPEIPKPRLTHVNPAVLIVGGNGSGMNSGASLKTAGVVDEGINRQWSGTLTWQGTDALPKERKEMCAQVTATPSKGDPCAFFYSLTICIYAPIQIGINMAKSLVTCACWTCGVNG